MKKVTAIFFGLLCGIIVFQFLFYKCESDKFTKKLDMKEQELQACIHAPTVTHIDTIRDTLRQVIHVPVTKYEVIQQTPVNKDTIIETREYTGTYNHPQFELHWSANVTGQLNDLTIKPPSIIKSLVITKEKTVDLTQYQTNEPKEKSHLYTTFGGTVLTDNFWGIEAGLMYIRKEGWGIQAGIGTDFKNLMYRGGMVIRLK